MRHIGVATILALFAGTATGQDPVPADKAAAWAEFEKKHGSTWRVDWCPATGTPEAIWGPGMRVKDGAIANKVEARRFARQALESLSALLGQGGSTFVEDIGEKVERVYIFVYNQKFNGLPVIGGRADVRIHDNGVLSLIGSQALPIAKGFNTVPTLNEQTARTAAYRRLVLPKPAKINRPTRLVVWGDIFMKAKSPVRLAWEVDIDVPARNVLGRAYIDAANGKLLRFESDVHDCGFDGCKKNGKATRPPVAPLEVDVIPDPDSPPNARMITGTVMAWTNTDKKPGAALKNVPLRGLKVGSTFTDANGKFSLPGTSVNVTITLSGRRVGSVSASQGTAFSRNLTLSGTNNVIQIYTSGAAQFDRSQTTAYYWTDIGNEFVRGIIGNKPQLARIDGIRANVNVRSACNATYSTSNVMNFYHAASGCPNTAYNTVVLHEWGHGYDQEFGGINRNEGMSEGSADVVAIVYNDDPVVGHDFRGPNTFVRTGNNTKGYPPTGGVHSMGETWMGFCWDCRNELVASLGQAAGVAHLRKLFIGYFVANPGSQPAGAREVALLDDNDGNLNNGTPNCNALIKALTKRKIPNPISGCPGIASYVNYGTGCPGSGIKNANCHSKNANCTRGSTVGTTIKYAMECVAPTGGATILGVDFYTRGRTGNTTGRVELRLADSSGAPLNTAVRTASAALTTTHQFYSFTFSTPLTVPQGQKFFLVYPGLSSMVYPYCSASNPRERVPYYYQRAGTTTWTKVASGSYWAFKVRCKGGPGAIPVLSNTGLPEIGKSFQIHLASAKPNARGFLLFGDSDRVWNGAPLPLDLVFMQAPGCKIGASGNALLAVTSNAQGSATVRLNVPGNSALIGVTFFNQFAIFDAQANPGGLAVSDNGKAIIGR